MADDGSNLDNVYGAQNAQATREAYEGWAEGYDAENIGNGYRVPGIGCAMISRHVDTQIGTIYDAACGTGIVGGILELLGYCQIVGSDLSPAMLKTAESLSAYQRLYVHDLGQRLPEPDDTFGGVTCFGSLGPGHAPASCLDKFVRVTRPGGHIVFNTRADTYAEQDLKGKVDQLKESGAWKAVDQSPIFSSYCLIEPEVTSQILVFQVC